MRNTNVMQINATLTQDLVAFIKHAQQVYCTDPHSKINTNIASYAQLAEDIQLVAAAQQQFSNNPCADTLMHKLACLDSIVVTHFSNTLELLEETYAV